MEVSIVRNQLMRAITAAKQRGQQRREQTVEAERTYNTFLLEIATPVTRQLAGALKAEGYMFTVFTPSGGLRLASDRGRDDYVEFALDVSGDIPHVIGRLVYTKGSRTITDERPLRGHTPPASLTEEDVLSFLLESLQPWLER